MPAREKENTTAIVLGITPYQDDSAIVSLAGEKGLFSLIAKGIYKPKSNLKGLLISGSLVNIEYLVSKKGPHFASSLQVLEDASMLMMNYSTSLYLMYLQELSLSLFAYGEMFPYFEIKKLLNALKNGGDVLSITLLTLGVMYRRFGIEMNVESCQKCHRKNNIVSFSLLEGGFICKDCLTDEDNYLDTMDLFVFKYAFSSIDEKNLKKIVPRENGLKVLVKLNEYLLSYFDLKNMKSFSLFLNALN